MMLEGDGDFFALFVCALAFGPFGHAIADGDAEGLTVA